MKFITTVPKDIGGIYKWVLLSSGEIRFVDFLKNHSDAILDETNGVDMAVANLVTDAGAANIHSDGAWHMHSYGSYTLEQVLGRRIGCSAAAADYVTAKMEEMGFVYKSDLL